MLGVRLKSVTLKAKTSPGTPNGSARIRLGQSFTPPHFLTGHDAHDTKPHPPLLAADLNNTQPEQKFAFTPFH